ncbi:HIT domain-containing protein [Gallaecimonas kandeliae]|uniref:HIT domain-containing protein n=1 Tax=Gallaecimonas kandeliae TaxID=3029055 RepID=UPI002649CD83|nr:HIT domain-containing protein [Gallaecimonas kandeliae]WKE65460.1 HIT domain-containing protein [Gallaecimonas kandeliae]
MFTLHPQLAADCHVVLDLPLCQLLMSKDANYPWFLLVPRREDVREIYELDEADQQQLWRESARLSKVLMNHFQGHKLNVAALGNMVPQLHLHHIVRFEGDGAWPKPVWGQLPAEAFAEGAAEARIAAVKALLAPGL